MKIHNHNLNIHYTAPIDIWDKLNHLYIEMPNWNGYVCGIPTWYGQESDEKLINVSVEPSGLQSMQNYHKRNGILGFHYLKARLLK